MFNRTWLFNTGIVFMMMSLVFLVFAMCWQHFAGAVFDVLMKSPENHGYAIRMTLSLLLHVPEGIARLLSLSLFAVGAGFYIFCVLTSVCDVIVCRLMLFISRKRKERYWRTLRATLPGSGATGRGEGQGQ